MHSLFSRLIRRISYVATAASLLAGCMLNRVPSATPASTGGVTPAPTGTAPNPSGWETLAPGFERRLYQAGGSLTQLMALRIDPAYFHFRAVYQPGQPLSIQRWRESLPEAVAFVNAN